MSSKKGLLVAIVIGLLLAATVVWSADRVQDKDQDQIQLQEQDQLQDGSCQDAVLAALATPKGNGDCDCDRLQDCDSDCDGVPDRDRLRDGSCLA